MPATKSKKELPGTLQRSSAKAQRTWAEAHDGAVETYGEGQRAHRTAYAALKHSFEKRGDHWEPKDRKGPSDPQAKQGSPAARTRPKKTHGGVDAEGNSRQELLDRAVEQVANVATLPGSWALPMRAIVRRVPRGTGHQACTDHLRVIERLMPETGVRVPDRQLACVPVGHEAARAYLGAMAATGNFAVANRHVMADAVRVCFAEALGRPVDGLGMRLVHDVAYNLAKLEEH